MTKPEQFAFNKNSLKIREIFIFKRLIGTGCPKITSTQRVPVVGESSNLSNTVQGVELCPFRCFFDYLKYPIFGNFSSNFALYSDRSDHVEAYSTILSWIWRLVAEISAFKEKCHAYLGIDALEGAPKHGIELFFLLRVYNGLESTSHAPPPIYREKNLWTLSIFVCEPPTTSQYSLR